jgi:hypothetical protein
MTVNIEEAVEMAVIEELIRVEDNGSLSFGNYLVESKKKVVDFEVNGDLYYVKTFNEITRLEKNGKLLLEAVPGATIHNFVMNEKSVSFQVEGNGDVQITMELEPDKDYRVVIDDFNAGSVCAGLSGKVNFSVDTKGFTKSIVIEKIG